MKSMSKIDDLIKELCPDGVEFKRLGEICEIKTGAGVTRKDIVEEGLFPIISGGIYPLGMYDRSNRKAKTVTIARAGSAGYVDFIDRDFYLNDKCFSVIPFESYQDNINSRFLYFALKNIEQSIIDMKSTGSVPTVNTQKVSKIKIPVPPPEIQKEIVRVLDSFTELEAELEAELKARKKQYEYYRNTLLTFNERERERVEYVQIGDICNMKRGRRVIKSQLNDTGLYPVYQNSLLPLGFFNEYNCRSGSVFMISAGAAGNIGFSNVDFWAADDCWIFDCSQNLSERFLYYALKNQQNTINSGVRRSSIPRLSRIFIENIKIPLPPLEKQKQIVSILDKFEKLTNDIAFGLPAEIDARRKQYEYYRTRLLTFKEA